MFSIQSIFGLGAAVQCLLFAVFSPVFAFIPVSLYLLYVVLTTLIHSSSERKNSYLSDIVHGRVTVQLPRRLNPSTKKLAGQQVVVFHMGVRFNHLLGMLCPGGVQMSNHFLACVDNIVARAEEFGLMHHSYWRGGERPNHNTLMVAFYFESVEKLNSFAHSNVHRKAWDWYTAFCKKHGKHMGVFHETFVVPPDAFETIYLNIHPVLLGETQVKVKNESGVDKFRRPLVDANTDSLRSQMSRLGRANDDISTAEEDLVGRENRTDAHSENM